MNKYILLLLITIALILTACGSGSNSNHPSGNGTPIQIGTLPNGSAVYLSQNNLPVSEGNSAQATIYLEEGSPNESYNVTFATSQQQATLKTTTENAYGISISTTPNPCIIGTTGSGTPTQCQITITSSTNTYDGTYLITPTATPTNAGIATILSPITVLVSDPITPSTKVITSFSLNGTNGVIIGNNIAVTLPYGTDITALIATYINTGTSVKIGSTTQDNGITSNNFINPVTYTVTAADGTIQNYTVTVTVAANSAKDITAFSLNGTDGVITGTNIAVTIPNGTPVTALTATFTMTGSSIAVGTTPQVSTVTPNDFNNSVIYTVTAADGSIKNYTVTSQASAASITLTPSTVNPSLRPGAYFTVNATLTGGDSNNQVLTLNNRSALQAIGVLVVSSESTNLNGCTLNSTRTSCTFNVIISAPTQVNATPPALAFVNSGSATVTPSTISYSIITPVNVRRTIQLPQTGQTTIYTVYDDANFLMGYPWVNNAAQAVTPPQRFTLSDGGCSITDNLTGLTWLRDPSLAGESAIWSSALSNVNGGTWCGKTAGTWRMPNVNELSSLINYGESNVVWWLNGTNGRTCAGDCFNNINSAINYWTSSYNAGNTTYQWNIALTSGTISTTTNGTPKYLLLPVYGTTSGTAAIPKTGANNTQSAPSGGFLPGSDNMLMKGITWPEPRFISDGPDCLTDKLTGLTWLNNANLASSVKLKWESAITTARNGSWCGHTDWRLPNVRELKSLNNYGTQYGATGYLSGFGFSNLQTTPYWTSTTTAQLSNSAWGVSLQNGANTSAVKSPAQAGSYLYMLPVRGGVNP